MGPQVNYKELMEKGAVIVDVRTSAEFSSGHIRNSINIPLNTLKASLSKLDKQKPIITCCASGMRSASAEGILLACGFTEVVNGGSWTSLEKKL